MDPLQHLATESRNPASLRLDELTALEIVDLMNREDEAIAAAVATQRENIARAIDVIAERFERGGRLIYIGAGTSGRLGVLDASECPPTFQSPPEQVIGLIAGGTGAMFRAVEGAEDSPELGATDLEALQLTDKDVLVGIATSGRTPYVVGGLRHGRSVGAFTIALACTPDAEIAPEARLAIVPVVGPEIVTGSTRLKAGTATKMVLNMLTTGAMVRLGKTFGNLMVDLKASNQKLVARSNRIVRSATGLEFQAAAELLDRCGGEVKTAIVSHLASVPPEEARARLAAAKGRVRRSLGELKPNRRNDLVLGIDGGGTKTFCMLADAASGKVLGQAASGPSNIQAVGTSAAFAALEEAIAGAFRDAGQEQSTVAAACLGLAGVDRQEGLDVIQAWASRAAIADVLEIANDATLLLAAGTPQGSGLAVIAGTGSITYLKTPQGLSARGGGWGWLLGDEGSGYRVGLRALQAICHAHDGTGPTTALTAALLREMKLASPSDLIPAVYRRGWDRPKIAALAPKVLGIAASGDGAAAEIVRSEAAALARAAATLVRRHWLGGDLPVALAGGLLLEGKEFREAFLTTLRGEKINPGAVAEVPEPAAGAVKIACRLAAAKLAG